MFSVCVPFVSDPHLANSACNRQFIFFPSMFILTLVASCVRISVRLPTFSSSAASMFVWIRALFPCRSTVVSAVFIWFVASTIGNNSNATTHACFMLFHFWKYGYLKVVTNFI